ncbi:MAG: N-acetyltransferase [Gaiellaceae bacterium MAG52_C11]|nr:N-acetyltransferase [Candidatus Gaiellasilicea maunaloa]
MAELPELWIRRERPEDAEAVFAVIEAAFGDRSVAEFAEQIRASADHVPELAFVAEEEDEIVGHTMLSYVAVEGLDRKLLVLTPMSVRPDRQRTGIGRALVQASLSNADSRGEPLVLCEGIPAYYPRFGFRSATALGLERPDERIPDAAWMAVPLRSYDPAIKGRVIYPSFFPPPPGA